MSRYLSRQGMILRISRLLAFVSLITFLVSISSLSWLDNRYVVYGQAPDPSSQRVVPYQVKDVVVYLREDQRRTLVILSVSEVASMVIFTLIVVLSGGRAVTSKWPWRRNRE